MSRPGRIVVAGRAFAVAGQAGASWAVLQYVIGLRELGYDVWLIEQVPRLDACTVATFEALSAEFDLDGRAALVDGGGRQTVGASFEAVLDACGSADALVNLSGALERSDLLERLAVRAYVDVDPVFNQVWHESGIDRGFDDHTHHFTFGTAIASGTCDAPSAAVSWRPTLPPVALSRWPPVAPQVDAPLTTLANWRSYGSVEAGGVFYGQKAHSLRALLDLPNRSAERFVLALAIHAGETADLDALDAGGWELVDPRRVAGTPSGYRDFITRSKAEIGVVKDGYVRARCGWFSDRSACYLASGRPVLAQDTGFAEALPTGEGLLAFGDVDTALAGLEQLASDYVRHVTSAREIAEAHLDSRVVLGSLLDALG